MKTPKRDPRRLIYNADVLMRCLVDCDIEIDGEAVIVRASKQRSEWHHYRLEITKEIYDALRDFQKMGQEGKK